MTLSTRRSRPSGQVAVANDGGTATAPADHPHAMAWPLRVLARNRRWERRAMERRTAELAPTG